MPPKLVSNPPNPWLSTHREFLDEPPPVARLEVYEEEARSILSENDSPDVGFRWSLNPYRGCFHGCAYCYARPTHQYLGWGAGTDFDRKIVVKTNAAELLREAFMRKSWRGESVVFSGVTDCYQPLEACYKLTRQCLEVCLEFRNPVGIVTKGVLVRRDVDVLSELAHKARAFVYVSVAFADDKLARTMETNTPPPSARFAAMRALAQAGVPVGVALAPVIPALNESHIPAVLERAASAGARRAFMTLLRLPAEVKDVFQERIREIQPLRAEHILSAQQDVRGGQLNDSRFGRRMEGSGPRWAATEDLFRITCNRLGINADDCESPAESTFRRPTNQPGLFGE